MKEKVTEAVKRLGDGWLSSHRLRGHWVNREEERRVQRPDLVDAMIMRRMGRRK